MKLDEIVTWYQKKIGTYDKQQWEKTVEQNILDGLSRVQLKTAKLKPELIDVDLVRGSTFQKEKPKQSLFTVIRLAICRYFFLPLYAQWWVKQTSSNAFALLLSLYLLQMVNWSVYTLNVRHNEAVNKNHVENTTETNIKETTDDNIIPLFELFIPMCISLLLSLIHSQIVATNSSTSSSKSKHRQYSKTNTNKVSREQRIRRRKKIIRLRSYDSTDTSVQQQQQILDAVIKKDTTDVQNLEYINSSKSETIHKEFEHIPIVQVYPFNKNCDNTKELNSKQSVSTEETKTEIINSPSPKKRNVNWHSTIQKYEVEILEKQQQISPPAMSSSPSPLASYNNSLEPVEIAIKTESKSVSELKVPSALRRNFGEDDGFESLNGKSSSGEENVSLQLMPGVPNTQLRQRTKVNNINNNNLENDVISNVIVNTRSRKTEPSSSEMDEDGDYEMEVSPTPATANCAHLSYNECTTSATEWLGVTTNSEECSYSSEYENSEGFKSEGDPYDTDCNPALLLNCHGVTDRISCTIWEQREVKKAQLSVLQISSCILERVDSMPETNDYVYLGICFAIIISLLPCICRLFESALESMDNVNDVNLFYFPKLIFENTSFTYENILNFAFGNVPWQRIVLIIAYLQRFCLSLLLFIIFAVAERTFKQRFLYAKLFSHLTSSRRARKSNLPHFRLNKVRNIKTWLSVRSYLKKRGPQRSVNVIVTSAFIVTLLLLAFLSVEFLKDSVQVHSQLNLEALLWATFIGIYLLRFMTLGNKIHEKYRSVSVLITEQINLYLQIEQKPKKKEELMVANSVLKLAADLLKELESPFKISGLCANPYLFTTIKVVILSALSGVLSEMLGFKLKLHKIKIK